MASTVAVVDPFPGCITGDNLSVDIECSAPHGWSMFTDSQQDWANRIAVQLSASGFARFDRIHHRGQLETLGTALGTIVPRQEHAIVTTIENRGSTGRLAAYRGFGTGELLPHTDRSGTAEPPGLLILVCAQKASSGGECLLVDGYRVYTDLLTSAPEAVEAFSAPRTALFGGASGYLGSVFEPTEKGRMRIRFRNDNLVKFSPDVEFWLPTLIAAINRNALRFALEPGQGWVLDNHRCLHGRTAFTGKRVMHRLSVNPQPELAIPSGFPTSHYTAEVS